MYLGTWASTIQWIKDAGGNGSVELDLYGGYKGTAGPVGYDVGVLRYQYPNNKLAISAEHDRDLRRRHLRRRPR